MIERIYYLIFGKSYEMIVPSVDKKWDFIWDELLGQVLLVKQIEKLNNYQNLYKIKSLKSHIR